MRSIERESRMCSCVFASLLASGALWIASCEVHEAGVPGAGVDDPNFEVEIVGDMAIATPSSPWVLLASGGSGPDTIYLHFDGLLIHRGSWSQNNAQNDTSFIPDQDTDITPFDGGFWPGSTADVADAVVQGVREDLADYPVQITTERPAQGGYTMVVVGGEPGDIGMSSNVLGVAPFDPQNWNPNDVAFVFSDKVGQYGYTRRNLANVISHEIAHTVGLNHIVRTGDIMTQSACHCQQSWGAGPLVTNPNVVQDDHAKLVTAFGTGTQSIGRLESIEDNNMAVGWACDPDHPDQNVTIRISVGGVAGSGAPEVLGSSGYPSNANVNSACGGGSAHGFRIQLPADHCGQPAYAYAADALVPDLPNTPLMGSPSTTPACPDDGGGVVPSSCGPGHPWIEEGNRAPGSSCGNTCSGYHWSWCDFDGDGSTSDGWQYCLSSGWASCGYHPH